MNKIKGFTYLGCEDLPCDLEKNICYEMCRFCSGDLMYDYSEWERTDGGAIFKHFICITCRSKHVYMFVSKGDSPLRAYEENKHYLRQYNYYFTIRL